MTEKEALNQAMKLCSRKEYASGEIEEKLLEWGLENEAVLSVLKELIKDKFIDNTRYCRAFVNDKLKFSKWGKIKISFMLRQKGVEEATVKQALENIDPETYEDILKTELVKKSKSIKSASEYEFKGKLIQFAVSRGFEYDISSKIVEKILTSR